MSGWDFATWRSASDDPVLRSTMIGLMVLDQAPDWDQLLERYERVSRVSPVLRKRVIDQGGLASPRLIVDPDFDLSFHVRRFRMPPGSTWSDVLDDARRQSMTDFDRDRPLWRTTILEGLPGGKAVMIMKLHHAIADGQGAMMLGATLFDFAEKPADLGPMPEAPLGETLGRRGFAEAVVRDNFGWAAKTAQDFIGGIAPASLAALRNPGETVARVAKTVGSFVRLTNIPLGPLSPLMTQRSINYHFGTFDVPFAEIRAVGKNNSHSVNDVFMAAVAEGMGNYHAKLGQPVTRLRVNMPVSLRKPGEGVENAVNVARFELPISTTDTLGLMDRISVAVTEIRKEPALAFANQMGELSRLIPMDIVSAAAQASDITASNVPGSPLPMWLAGARIERMYPLVATIGAAVNVTMLTYAGTASIGISSDDAAVSNPDELLRCMRDGFARATGRPVAATSPIAVTAEGKATQRTRTSPVKKASVMKPAARKTPAKKVPAKKTPAKRAPSKKTPAHKAV